MANWEEFEKPFFVPDRTIRPVSKEEREFYRKALREGAQYASHKDFLDYKEQLKRVAKAREFLARIGIGDSPSKSVKSNKKTPEVTTQML